MGKHTPGPWIVSNERLSSGAPVKCIRRGDDKSVYNIAVIGDRMPSAAQWMPNARLIAAAPEMLDALEQLAMGLFDVSHNLVGPHGDQCEHMRQITLKAIAMARGES
jgi:hypothetical protein